MWCHVTVVHGYKNKALLVDLDTNNDGIEDPDPPYVQNTGPSRAFLKVVTWGISGDWDANNCGIDSSGGDNQGMSWMKKSCRPAVLNHLATYPECQ